MAIKVGKCSLNLMLIITETRNHLLNASEPRLEKHGLFKNFLEFFLLWGGTVNIGLLFTKCVENTDVEVLLSPSLKHVETFSTFIFPVLFL